MKTKIDNQGRVHNPATKISGAITIIMVIIIMLIQANNIKLEKNKFNLTSHTDPQELKNNIGQIVEIDDNVYVNTKTLVKQYYEDEDQVTYKSIGIADIETDNGTIEVFYQTKSTNHRNYEMKNRLRIRKLSQIRLDESDREEIEKYIPYNETYSSMLYLEATDGVEVYYFMIVMGILVAILGLFMIIHNPRVKQQSIDEMIYM